MDSAKKADLLKRKKHSTSPGADNLVPSASTETSRVPLFLAGMAEAYVSAGGLIFFFLLALTLDESKMCYIHLC